MQLNNWLSRLVQSCTFPSLPSLSLSLILPHAASTGLSHALFLWSQGACYSSSNSTWQGDLCPTQDGLNWGGRDGGVTCPVSNAIVSAPLPPCPGPSAGLQGKREAVAAACPLMLGPLLDSGEWKETKQGEGLSNTHRKSCLCLCRIWQRMHILKHTEPIGQNRAATDMWVMWVQMQLAHKSQLDSLHEMLSLFQEILWKKYYKKRQKAFEKVKTSILKCHP